jgi:uncharacterized membrane protein
MRTLTLLNVVLVYFFLVGGLNYFILQEKKSVWDAFLLGVMVYGVFETTSYVMFDNWSMMIVLLDTLWGGVLFATTTFITNKLTML